MRNRIGFSILLVSLAATSLLSAQQTNPPVATNQTNEADMRMMQHMQELDTMAKSMTSMVCWKFSGFGSGAFASGKSGSN